MEMAANMLMMIEEEGLMGRMEMMEEVMEVVVQRMVNPMEGGQGMTRGVGMRGTRISITMRRRRNSSSSSSNRAARMWMHNSHGS